MCIDEEELVRYHYIIGIRKKYALDYKMARSLCQFLNNNINIRLKDRGVSVNHVIFEKGNSQGLPHIHISFDCFSNIKEESLTKVLKYVNQTIPFDDPMIYSSKVGVICEDFKKESCPGKLECNKISPLHKTRLECQLHCTLIPSSKVLSARETHKTNMDRYLNRKKGKQNTLYFYERQK